MMRYPDESLMPMSNLDPNTPLRQAAQVVSQELADEAVLLHLEQERYYSLNEVGARIWALIGDGRSLASVVEHIAAEFDAEEATIAADALALAEELLAAGLIELGPGRNTPTS